MEGINGLEWLVMPVGWRYQWSWAACDACGVINPSDFIISWKMGPDCALWQTHQSDQLVQKKKERRPVTLFEPQRSRAAGDAWDLIGISRIDGLNGRQCGMCRFWVRNLAIKCLYRRSLRHRDYQNSRKHHDYQNSRKLYDTESIHSCNYDSKTNRFLKAQYHNRSILELQHRAYLNLMNHSNRPSFCWAGAIFLCSTAHDRSN